MKTIKTKDKNIKPEIAKLTKNIPHEEDIIIEAEPVRPSRDLTRKTHEFFQGVPSSVENHKETIKPKSTVIESIDHDNIE